MNPYNSFRLHFVLKEGLGFRLQWRREKLGRKAEVIQRAQYLGDQIHKFFCLGFRALGFIRVWGLGFRGFGLALGTK